MLQLHFRHPENGHTEALDLSQAVAVLVAHELQQVLPQLQALADWQARGYGAAGYLAYEAAAALQPSLACQPSAEGVPLLWFAVFAPAALQQESGQARQTSQTTAFRLQPWQAEQDEAEFAQRIAQIQTAIARGESYQVNYTLPFSSSLQGSARALYAAMRCAQRAPYAAYLEVGGQAILSASPELFFHWQGQAAGGQILTQPMKGTRPRGLWSAQDQALAQELASSEKDRAENVMIVDLLRNDLGQIARAGSVGVDALFSVERYPSVWQMTSRIRATTRPEVGLVQVLQALFPCGSITGAPKHQTMRLIRALEPQPRGVYCGSIGLLRPDGSATFSVAIRTLTLGAENHGQRPARYHAGAGITWGSDAAAEWQEVQAKTRIVHPDFLQQQNQEAFALIETLLWTGREFALLSEHEQRLAASAAYHAYPFHAATWRSALQAGVKNHTSLQRVRSLLHADGRIEVGSTPLPADFQPSWQRPAADAPSLPVCLAAQATPKSTASLYHKTTHRQVYAQALVGKPDGAFDVLLHNEDGQLCEFTIGNLVLRLDGVDYTPPIGSGLLPGVLRAALLAQGLLHERVLYPADLARAEGMWLINSVRGWVRVRM
jgi:para-aminobenzoate synthetase/4-amino-4-deoxychorismate lyase